MDKNSPNYDMNQYQSGYDSSQGNGHSPRNAQQSHIFDRIGNAATRFKMGDAMSVEMGSEAQSVFATTMRKVFMWLFIGLSITAASALAVTTIPALQSIVYSMPGMIILMMTQLGLNFAIALLMWKASPTVVKALFLTYTFVLGLTLSSIFFTYDLGSIVISFAASAAVFGAMAAVGHFIKKDLSPLGHVGYMLLFGSIIITLVNVFIYMIAPEIAQRINMFMNYIILAIFIGLTAYDMQRIKLMAIEAARAGYEGDTQMSDRIAIRGAMHLYLDFINIFLRILAIFGRRRR